LIEINEKSIHDDLNESQMNGSDDVIEVRDLTKRYGGVVAVDHISFSVARGEIFGLLGPNGAGKTTTILMMIGLTDRNGGSISIMGHDPAREPLKVKRVVGYLPDTIGFYDNMTARENLRYTAALMGIKAADRDQKIATALERAGLSDVAEKRVGTFSRGMRQRLGLAEILMKDVAIAVLDEPTSGLDPQATEEFLESIRSLKRDGVAVLLSSHLLERVQSVCDRVALFNCGRIALIGNVPELATQVLGGGYHVEVEADGQELAATLAAVPGVRAVEQLGADRFRLLSEGDVRSKAAAAVVNKGGDLRRLSFEEPSLGAIYSRYFQNQGDQSGGGKVHS
jgi:ABC-2 type transport system ATP-binding protein